MTIFIFGWTISKKYTYFLPAHRGIVYRRLKDFTAAIEDLILAVEFYGVGEDPPQGGVQDNSEDLEEEAQTQLVLTYNDFAIQCFSRGLYGEAIMLLNKAIEKQRDASELFINRGGVDWEIKRLMGVGLKVV